MTPASIRLMFHTLRRCKSIWLFLFIVLYFVFPRYSRFSFVFQDFVVPCPYSCHGFLLFSLWLHRPHRRKVLLQYGPAELEYAASGVLWVLFVIDLSELLSLTIFNSSSCCPPAVCHVSFSRAFGVERAAVMDVLNNCTRNYWLYRVPALREKCRWECWVLGVVKLVPSTPALQIKKWSDAGVRGCWGGDAGQSGVGMLWEKKLWFVREVREWVFAKSWTMESPRFDISASWSRVVAKALLLFFSFLSLTVLFWTLLPVWGEWLCHSIGTS